MKQYIKESLEKFRKDALSKLIYDVLKWLIPVSVFLASSYLLPEGTTAKGVISRKYSLSIYTLLIGALLTIIGTIMFVNFLFIKKYRELEKDNFTDELTGLKNYKALKRELMDKIQESNTSTKGFSIILLDIDNFKEFNNKHGYSLSDRILSKVGQLLNGDKRITDETYRQFLRGDEFLILAGETNLNDAYRAAERKRKFIESTTFTVDDQPFRLTVSCGVTEFKKGQDTYESVTNRANAALIEAKKQLNKNYTKTFF